MPPKSKPKVSESAPASTPTAAPAPSEPKAPTQKFAADDNSIDARMWRLNQDHIAMGARQAEKPAKN